MIGEALAHFKITAKLGEGGMGEVWRAVDTRLGREVAIKILPEAFADDPERLARFEREARVLATLNHPHIAQVHSLEEFDSRKLLVLELVEGETLAERISRGSVPIDRALEIALEIARALEAAHECGIVHRDLKPANVKITPDAEVKVLDFGLAKAIADPEAAEITHSPTLTYESKTGGALLGTAPYMSPEQARGHEVDKRSDIWSFGVVLWEMLTGRRLFEGETISDVLAAVLRAEPSWEELPNPTPGALRKLLRRCLTREPENRLHDIADARLEIEDCLHEPESAVTEASLPTAGTSRRAVVWSALLGAAVSAVLGLSLWLWSDAETSAPGMKVLEIRPPPYVELARGANLALSPDGRWVAFVGETANSPGRDQLFLRSVRELDARPVAGTEGARNPFFSPDGLWVGFGTDDALWKVRLTGGPPESICRVRRLRGASWGADGTILFTGQLPEGEEALFQVPAGGGTPKPLAEPQRDQGISSVRWPQHLPGDQSALVSVRRGFRESNAEISVLSLTTGERRTLLTGGTYPRLLGSGHLIYSRLGTIHALPFDLEDLEIEGDAVPILDDVHGSIGSGAVALAVSESGSAIHVREERPRETHLVWVDESGDVESDLRASEGRFLTQPSLSPDSNQIVVEILTNEEETDLWIYDLERANWSRLTDRPGKETRPVWSPDGRWIYFSSTQNGPFELARIRSDGTGASELLTTEVPVWEFPNFVSKDGRSLVFERQVAPNQFDLLALQLEAESSVTEPVVVTPYSERLAALSPDGHWMAYESMESGRAEIYIQPYPGPSARIKLSTGGGRAPRWHPEEDRVFYVDGRDLWSVSLETGQEFRAGRPQRLFTLDWDIPLVFDVETSAGRPRFLIEQHIAPAGAMRLVYISNWYQEVERIVAATSR